MLVFLEVKYRKNLRIQNPGQAVSISKQQRIYQSARYYLYCHGFGEDTPCRFDVVVFVGESVRLIKNAFGGI